MSNCKNIEKYFQLLLKSGVILQRRSTPDVLSCLEAKEFWLSWQDGLIVLAQKSESGKKKRPNLLQNIPTVLKPSTIRKTNKLVFT